MKLTSFSPLENSKRRDSGVYLGVRGTCPLESLSDRHVNEWLCPPEIFETHFGGPMVNFINENQGVE